MTSTESARASQQNETSDALTETRSCDISISDVITEAPPSYEASLHQSGSNARLYSSQSQLVENVGNVATISNGQMGPMESPPMYPGPPVSAAGGYPKDVYPLPPYQTVYSSYSSYGYPVNTNANVVANGGDAAQARAMVSLTVLEFFISPPMMIFYCISGGLKRLSQQPSVK